jgi:hypothetical protein
MKPKVSEHDVQTQILNWLKQVGIYHYRQNTGGAKLKGFFVKFGKKGAPDIVAVHNGRYIGIEVKAKGGVQSPEQKSFQLDITKADGLYILAYSLEDVTKVLGRVALQMVIKKALES